MRTASQQAALTAPDAAALHNALERVPAEVLDEEKAARRRSRMRILRRHTPRHGAVGGETAEDADTVAMEFREMRQDEAARTPARPGWYEAMPPAPRHSRPQAAPVTGPQPAWPTGPQPRFTPHRNTGPQPRHRDEIGRILGIAHHRADRVPVPDPPAITSAAAFAQNTERIAQLPLPGCDASDGYGHIPAHVAYMRRVSYFTGTSSRFDFPAAWPLPVAPLVPQHMDDEDSQTAVTPGDEASHQMPPWGGAA